MNILERNPQLAEAYAEQIGKAVAKVSTHADTLKWIAKAEGDLYVNISNVAGLSAQALARNPAFCRTTEMFSGPMAARLAKEDATDAETENTERTDYVTTIVLRPDGTWSEQYLFRV